MSKSLVIRGQARLDLLEAVRWYDRQQTGLGSQMMDCVQAKLADIQERPGSFPVVYQHDIRRAMLGRFPYGIFFIENEDQLVVLAIFHLSQNIRRRIASRR